MLGPSDRPGRISIPCADAAVAPTSMMDSAKAMCFIGSPPQDCLAARCQHLKFNFVPLIYDNSARHCSWRDIWYLFRIVAVSEVLSGTQALAKIAGRAGDATPVVRYKHHERMADAG